MIPKDGLNWRVNGASTHARQLVAVFQVLCPLYRLTCVSYAQNTLEFVTRSPLIHAKILCCIVYVLFSTDAAALLAIGEHAGGVIWIWRTFSFKCYVDHSHTMYNSRNIDVRDWVHLFESHCILITYETRSRTVKTYLLIYSMVQSTFWEANWLAASQEIPRISRNPKVHYLTHKRPTPVSILGQPNPVHIPTSHFLEIHPNIINLSTPRSPQWSPSHRFSHQHPIHSPLLTHTRHMPSPSHFSRFYHQHDIGWGVQIRTV